MQPTPEEQPLGSLDDERLLGDLRVVLDRRSQREQGQPPAATPVGWQLAQYVVKKLIGEGGMAHVYLAADLERGRDVALKVLKRELQASTDICARFEQEARAMGRIQHPNVVQVFDTPSDQGMTGIAMELLDGGSLRDLLKVGSKRHRRMGVNALTRFALETANGLGAAHAAGIVHRDIKPSNLLLDRSGRVKVADFGVVLALERATWLTGLGRPIGTPAYMSPEQCRGDRVGAASDIYSLGVTLFELATGELPFTEQAESPFALMLKHIREPAPDARRLRPDFPAWFARLLARCLEKDPGERYADGAALSRAIESPAQFNELELATSAESTTVARLDTATIREQLKRLPQRAIVAWACRCARRALYYNQDPRVLRSIESAEMTLRNTDVPDGDTKSLSHALLRIQQLRSASFSVVDGADAAAASDSAACAALAAAAACACASARCAADAAADAAFVAQKAISALALAGVSTHEAWRAAQKDYRRLLAAKLGAEGTVGRPIPEDFWDGVGELNENGP